MTATDIEAGEPDWHTVTKTTAFVTIITVKTPYFHKWVYSNSTTRDLSYLDSVRVCIYRVRTPRSCTVYTIYFCVNSVREVQWIYISRSIFPFTKLHKFKVESFKHRFSDSPKTV